MKAVILTAGVGSRIRPLTDNTPKPLLLINGKSILERMIDGILSVGIKEIIVITGYRANQITEFLNEKYPNVSFTFIHNDKYKITNTGYSMLLTKEAVGKEDFIKFDGDVVFEKEVLKKLVTSDVPSALCIDTNINLEAEEVKVILDEKNQVQEVGKKLDPHLSTGESIGIEKIEKEAGKVFFAELEKLMQDEKNWQEYYDDTYTTLVAKGVPFYAVDITGLDWVEIDTHEDFHRAEAIFTN